LIIVGAGESAVRRENHFSVPIYMLHNLELMTILSDILEKARTVLTAPGDFYRHMPKSGGFVEPMIFMMVMAAVGAIILITFGFLGLEALSALGVGIASLIFTPIMAGIGSFIGGAGMYVIWKLMGTQEPFELTYRCVAYASAIYPVTHFCCSPRSITHRRAAGESYISNWQPSKLS
jgi:hypothetical protein